MGIGELVKHTRNFAESSYFEAFSLSCFVFSTSKNNQSKCVNVSQSTLDKLVYKSVTPVGSCTALSMASSLMVKCQVTRPLEVEMILSTPSSVRLEQENTFLELFLSILSQL